MQKRTLFWCLAAAIPLFLVLQFSLAQDTKLPSIPVNSHATKSLKIVPVVSLKPGETKQLMLSTHCTVGATRGGGFALAEMRDGGSKSGTAEGHAGASYERDGVRITIPGWEAAQEFTSHPRFLALKEQGMRVFEVSVSASEDTKPGLLNMHLVDATCRGDCSTDFRVLVLGE